MDPHRGGVVLPWYTRLLQVLCTLLLFPVTLFAAGERLVLDAEQKHWLSAHPQLRLGVDPDWAPFEFIDDEGVYRGMAADTRTLLAQRLAVSMHPVDGLSWSEVLEAVRIGEVDVLPAVTWSEARSRYLNFTQPYLDFPMVVITRLDAPRLDSLDGLAGRRVAVVNNYVSHELLASNHPDLDLVPTDNLEAGLKAVALHSVDAFVGNLASVSYSIERLGLGNLKVAVHTPYSFKLAMGVRKDWPELIPILDQALDSLSDAERRAIHSKWVQLRVEEGVRWQLLLPIAFGVALLLGLILMWNRRLRREITERREIEARLRASEERLNTSQQVGRIGSWDWNIASGEIDWSLETYNLLGYTGELPVPTFRRVLRHVPGRERHFVFAAIRRAITSGSDFQLTHRLRQHTGGWLHVEAFGRIYRDDRGRPMRMVGVLHDISSRMRAEQALRTERRTLQKILDNAPIGIWLQNANGKLLFVNRAFCDSVGISEEQFLSVPHYAQLYPPASAASCMASDADALAHEGPRLSYEKVQFVDGQVHDLEIIKVRQSDDEGRITGLIGLSLDVTARMKAEEQLRYQAFYDSLTGLPNRTLLLDQLNKVLAQARRHEHHAALLFFDLDNFKVINDSLGHAAGDRLLHELGQRLINQVREEDTAARLGGDEFVVILPELSGGESHSAEQSRQVAEKLQRVISEPYIIDDQEFHITVSIGISLFPLNEKSAEDILKHADTAMYRAKEQGSNGISFFLPSMQQVAEERLRMQNALRRALEQGDMALHYQPQCDAQGAIVGCEALLRWHDSQLGQVPPAVFVPVAEEIGLIQLLGQWVLHQALDQLRCWRDEGLLPEGFTLAVNVSPRQFNQPDFVALVQMAIAASSVQPSMLELEVTERLLISDVDEVESRMRQLHDIGVCFSIDDFGTGYSSLAYLRRLPLDRLKIDRSFVSDLMTDANDALIVETIIDMAHHLGFEVVAEGVEQATELEFLTRHGCEFFQGYYFDRPLTAEAFRERLLAAGEPG